ncbi:MAG: 23S rRNA (guanosine(2251)-2'-O)-methyltransferase RlmB [Bacilli bacterium]|nr:23S rRNA (guanosine(2251)-2'-O)-methyltransferase RlmB [Bacilli bacterium]
MYIYGKNVAREKLRSGEEILKVYLSRNFHDEEIFDLIREKKIRTTFLDSKIMDKKVDGHHQGIILETSEVKTYSLDNFLESIHDNDRSLVVMLDHLEDPHNFGAIIRTAEALGVDSIIIPNDRSVTVNSTVVKTSAGAISYMKIVRVANLGSAISKLKKNGFWVVGTDMDGEDYSKIDYSSRICLVIGNEGKGISNVVRKNCDFIASIPMSGKINSLNASVSCGIVLSEIVLSRRS